MAVSPIYFTGQWSNEQVLLGFRSHPVVLSGPLIKSLLLLAIGVGAWTGLVVIDPDFVWAWLLALAGALIAILVFGRAWLMWHLSRIFVTDQRLVRFYYRGIFHKQISEVSYDRIATVNYRVRGLFNVMLAVGSIEVETLAATPVLLESIHKPKIVSSTISQALNEWRDRRQIDQPNRPQTEI